MYVYTYLHTYTNAHINMHCVFNEQLPVGQSLKETFTELFI